MEFCQSEKVGTLNLLISVIKVSECGNIDLSSKYLLDSRKCPPSRKRSYLKTDTYSRFSYLWSSVTALGICYILCTKFFKLQTLDLASESALFPVSHQNLLFRWRFSQITQH